MPRAKATLPEETERQLEHLTELEQRMAELNEEYDQLLLRTATRYGINATARGLGISEYVMHKKIGRIRQALGAVQHQEAA